MYNQSPNILCKNFHLEAKIPQLSYVSECFSHNSQYFITLKTTNNAIIIIHIILAIYKTKLMLSFYILAIYRLYLD